MIIKTSLPRAGASIKTKLLLIKPLSFKSVKTALLLATVKTELPVIKTELLVIKTQIPTIKTELPQGPVPIVVSGRS